MSYSLIKIVQTSNCCGGKVFKSNGNIGVCSCCGEFCGIEFEVVKRIEAKLKG